MFTTVSYDIKPVQPEAVWDGIIQKDSMWCFPKEWDYKKALKTVVKNHTTLKEEVLKTGLVDEKDYEKIMNPIKMTKPK